jgi:hypothetical protein
MSAHDDDLPAAQSDDNALALLEDQAEKDIRRVWHEGRMWLSVIDMVGLLTDSNLPRVYWAQMKRRLADDEGFAEVFTNCKQLKMRSADGRQRTTDAADAETLLRIVQSIPSPKAEPIKRWLAKVGAERLAEMDEPSLAVERARKQYQERGYTDDWIEKRLQSKVIRDALAGEWVDRGAADKKQMATLTNILHTETFDMSVAQHQAYKGITPRQNLRDSMSTLELLFTSLSEEGAKMLHQGRDSQGMGALSQDAREAGQIAGDARRELEDRSGQRVVSQENYKELRQGRQRELQPSLFGEENTDDTDTDDAGDGGSGGAD